MSNAVTPLTAVIVQSNLLSNLNLKNSKSTENLEISGSSNETNTVKEENSSIHERAKASSVGLSSSPSATSSSPTSSTSSRKAEPNTNQMTNQVPQSQVHQVPIAGLQYFQYPSNNSTTPLNVSPMSSMTSSPSTTNTPNTAKSNASIHFSTQPHFFHHPHQPIAYAPTQHIHAFNPNFKDTRWLTLEVCREFQRNKCNRTDTDCKFAHPPPHVEIVNGKVIACYDSLKGKCSRKEPPCKYLHPPQHLKDQLLQNGKNNLVLRQVALAMMQQHNQQPINPAMNQTVLATNPQLAQYATYPSATGQISGNPTSANLIPTMPNSGLAYSTLQLNPNGQPTLLPMIAGQAINLGQQGAFLDPSTLLHQVGPASTLSPGAAAATANGLLAPQQRTDRLMGHQELNDHQIPYAIDNGQGYMLPPYQVYHHVYQRAPNTPLTSNKTTSSEETAQNSDVNKTASASATAVNAAVNANQVDVVPGKKRTHDAVEQDFIPVQNGTTSAAQSGAQIKRTAIADIKTGLPVFQSFNSGQANFQHFALAQQSVSPALNYSQAINIPLQYAPYISLPYPGHQSGIPRM